MSMWLGLANNSLDRTHLKSNRVWLRVKVRAGGVRVRIRVMETGLRLRG